tara:strand:- start:1231 stop:1842 length:612 start_codon:yes stop_codon:yes gene_type:complete
MLAGVILAGGKSSRMGTNKSLLTLPDSQLSLLEHCQKELAMVCDNNVFISGSEHEQGIADVIPNCGPLSGIHAAIAHIKIQQPDTNELLVVAVDMPNLHTEDFSYLLKTGRENHCLCTFENCFLPLYIPLSVDIAQYLDTIFKSQPDEVLLKPKQRQYSIKRLLNTLHSLQIQPLKNTQLDNINTFSQWQQHCAKQPFTKASK